MNLKLKQFDPSTQLKDSATVLLVGRRGSGKSTLMRDLMWHMRDRLDFGLAMSPTEESTASLGGFVPRSCIYNNFDSTALDTMLELQRKSVKRGKWKKMYIILDDCAYEKRFFKGSNMRELLMNGRHRKVFLLNAVQYVMDIGPDIRSQIDFVFALKENVSSNREKLWKCFFGMFERLADFNRVMMECTTNFEALVLDNTKRSNDITDCVYWYKANPDHPPFRVGNPIFWALDEQYYYDMDDETLEISRPALSSAKAHTSIHSIEKTDSNGDAIITPHTGTAGGPPEDMGERVTRQSEPRVHLNNNGAGRSSDRVNKGLALNLNSTIL